MNYIDLVSLLKVFGNKGMEKVGIYGRIVSRLPKPSNIFDSVKISDTGIFVRVDVFAVNLGHYESYLKQNGIHSQYNSYMVNGSIIAFIEPEGHKLPEWYQLWGTLRFGTKDLSNTYVGLLTYYKSGDNWVLKPSDITDFSIEEFGKGSELYECLIISRNKGFVIRPNEVLLLPKFDAVIRKPNVPQLGNNMSLNDSLSSSINNVNIQSASAQPSFNKECRDTIKGANDLYNKLNDLCINSYDIRRKFLEECASDYSLGENETYEPLEYMVNSLCSLYSSRLSNNGSSGRTIVKKYLANIGGSQDSYLGNRTIASYLLDIFETDIKGYILNGELVSASGKAWEVCRSAFSIKERFYAGILGVVLNISFDDTEDILAKCNNFNMSFMRIVNENPYMLQLVSSLSFDKIERIAICFQKHSDTSLSKFRNIAMLNDYIMDSSNESTLFYRNNLINSEFGITLTQARYNQIRNTGTYFSGSMVSSINAYIKPCKSSDLGYSPNRFSKHGMKYIEHMDSNEKIRVIQDYTSCGLGVVLNNKYITSLRLLERELFVYNTMKELGSITYDYDDADIDKYISEYEEIVGFKLEERQVMAVHLLKHAGFVVAGGAGSGKTTVSNCIVYVLDKLENNLNKKFAAPTGKAAKRMQEVVKCEVKTLHSEFHLGLESSTVFDKESSEVSSNNIAYFFDEGAMITLDLLYSVLSRIDTENCRVFLFGDFDQLSPIGKGLPFKNLLRFMPCVFLNVTKRAVEGSNITYNANIINDYSSPSTWKQLVSGKDFFLLPCKSDRIQELVLRLCRHYLGKGSSEDTGVLKGILGVDSLPVVENLTPDDIQVVSPLSKPTYIWGTSQLNAKLQPIFNNNRGYSNTFIYQLTANSNGSKFIIGDRVIHVEKNMYSMQWYESYDGGVFVKRYGYGICNGEVGKLVAVFNSTECEIEDEVEQEPDGFKYKDNMRDDSSWNGDNKYFVVVEYWDYITESNFYILYRAEVNTGVDNSNVGIIFKGDDLGMLNLFYAGTTHKLQGSQAKLIISCLDVVNYSGFITREQLYTMFTRGEKLVFVIGSVDNSRSSMLSRARCDLACTGIDTIGEIII